jgi:flagellar hook-associated protein 2
MSFSLTLGPGGNTLANLRDAINDAPGNSGVQATLITDIAGTHLILTGSATGAANALRVTTSGGNGGLNQFVYNPPTTTNLAPLSTAQDAIVFVSGYEIHDADNSIDSAIDGVTLQLKQAHVGEVTTLAIATDNAGIRDRVNSFVNGYNVLANQIAKLRSYNAETKVAGPLLGDAMLRNIEAQLRRVVSAPVAGATEPYTSLASLGITTTAAGTLSLDQAKFDAALADDPAAASHVFAAGQGVAVQLDAFLADKLSVAGELANRDAGIAARRKDLTRQKEALDARMEVIQARYMRQFNALDSMLTKLQSTSSYLSQQLAAAAAQQKG